MVFAAGTLLFRTIAEPSRVARISAGLPRHISPAVLPLGQPQDGFPPQRRSVPAAVHTGSGAPADTAGERLIHQLFRQDRFLLCGQHHVLRVCGCPLLVLASRPAPGGRHVNDTLQHWPLPRPGCSSLDSQSAGMF